MNLRGTTQANLRKTSPAPRDGQSPVHKRDDYTDKKDNKVFLIYKEIQNGAVAKSYMTNGLLIYD
jgi:hypothetical protein